MKTLNLVCRTWFFKLANLNFRLNAIINLTAYIKDHSNFSQLSHIFIDTFCSLLVFRSDGDLFFGVLVFNSRLDFWFSEQDRDFWCLNGLVTG